MKSITYEELVRALSLREYYGKINPILEDALKNLAKWLDVQYEPRPQYGYYSRAEIPLHFYGLYGESALHYLENKYDFIWTEYPDGIFGGGAWIDFDYMNRHLPYDEDMESLVSQNELAEMMERLVNDLECCGISIVIDPEDFDKRYKWTRDNLFDDFEKRSKGKKWWNREKAWSIFEIEVYDEYVDDNRWEVIKELKKEYKATLKDLPEDIRYSCYPCQAEGGSIS